MNSLEFVLNKVFEYEQSKRERLLNLLDNLFEEIIDNDSKPELTQNSYQGYLIYITTELLDCGKVNVLELKSKLYEKQEYSFDFENYMNAVTAFMRMYR